MLTLMERAGESAMNDLWHSVVQVRLTLVGMGGTEHCDLAPTLFCCSGP